MWMNSQIVVLDSAAASYYTPWFGKSADNGVFTMEVLVDTARGFTVTVWSKNAEDEGSAPGSLVGTFSSLAGAFYEAACTGLRDMVRFRINLDSGGAAGDGLIYRFLGPTWYDTAV